MGNNMAVPQKIKNRVTPLPSNPLLGMYLNNSETFTHKDMCPSVFTAALFTVAKTWRQSVSLLRGLDKDVVHIYNEILLSHKIKYICNMDEP